MQKLSSYYRLSVFLAVLLAPVALGANFMPKSFHTQFQKKYTSGIYGKEVITKGEIFYQYPGQLRIDTHFPEQELLISTPKKTIIYTPPFIEDEQGTLSVKNNQDLGYAKIFDILKNGLKDNTFFAVKNVPPHGKELVFKEQFKEKYKIIQLVIVFRTAEELFRNIKEIKVIHWDKKEETFAFEQVQVDIPLGKQKFEFQPPPNTTIQ